MKVKYQLHNQELETDSVADIMNAAGKLRWSNLEGEQSEAKNATIHGLRSDSPCMVVVKREGESRTFPSIRFAESKDNTVFLTGPGTMERVEDSEIMRIRDQTV